MEFKNSILVFFKLIVFSLSIVLQLVFLGFVYFKFTDFTNYVPTIFWIIRLFTILFIIYPDEKSSYKISWMFFIMIMPIAGTLSYFIFEANHVPPYIKIKMNEITKSAHYKLKQNNKIYEKLNQSDRSLANKVELLYNLADAPIYNNTSVSYFKVGEDMFEKLLDDLNKATKFIFIDFYIIKNGYMFDSIFEILKRKASEGLEVIIICDSMGSTKIMSETLNDSYTKYKIKSFAFNKYRLSIYDYLSFRDHRKIVIIDGNISYTGGTNIGDEYINKEIRFGHWKDMSIRLEGDATYSFTIMFLQMYEYLSNDRKDLSLYMPTLSMKYAKGYAIPYCDGPTVKNNPAENIYKRIVASAKQYVYISTPYLQIDSDFIGLLNLAAESGVDVRIIIPHIPDKKFVFRVSKSFYSWLLPSGVKIYEYTPGFNHGKVVVSDDKCAVVGSVNMDYRSLAWNYESAVFVTGCDSIIDIKNDFIETFLVSQEVTYEEHVKTNLLSKLLESVLRLLAPLM